MGNHAPVVDAYWCMAKPIQYCKVNNNNNRGKKDYINNNWVTKWQPVTHNRYPNRRKLK